MSPLPELERIKSEQYQEGKAYLETNPSVASVVDRLAQDCPHVARRDLVALFHLRNAELAVATAHRLEYNATHPPEGLPRLPE